MFVRNLVIDFFWKNDAFASITLPFIIAIFIITVIALTAVTFLICIGRFQQTMVGNEGYLTHTLPVTVDQLIFSRLIVAFTYNIITAIIMLLLIFGAVGFIFMLSGAYQEFNWNDWNKVLLEIDKELGFNQLPKVLWGAVQVFAGLIGVISSLLICYMAVALAQCMKNHRILWTAVFYICINIGYQLISNIIASLGFMVPSFMTASQYSDIENLNFAQLMLNALGVNSILAIIVGVAAYFVTRYIFTRHLNLE